MVAGMLAAHSIHIGSNYGNNYEDPIFESRRIPAIKEAIKSNNKDHDIWGWKYPEAAYYLDRIWDDLINPHVIVVYRDLVATSMAHIRWHGRIPKVAFSNVLLDNQRNFNLLMRRNCPQLWVSYEKSISHPTNFKNELSNFLDIQLPPDFNYQKFMQPGKYKEVSKF